MDQKAYPQDGQPFLADRQTYQTWDSKGRMSGAWRKQKVHNNVTHCCGPEI